MRRNKDGLGSNLAKVDATTDEEIARQMAEDDTPELTEDEFAAAEVWEGDRFIRRVGRPKGSGKKELVTLRIDRDVLDRFRASGPGWQTRLNDELRAVTVESPRRSKRTARAAKPMARPSGKARPAAAPSRKARAAAPSKKPRSATRLAARAAAANGKAQRRRARA